MTAPKAIDPDDPLHTSVEKVLVGLSPKERAARLNEMFDKPRHMLGKPSPTQPPAESDASRAKTILGLELSEAELKEAKALGFL